MDGGEKKKIGEDKKLIDKMLVIAYIGVVGTKAGLAGANKEKTNVDF